MIQKPDGWTLLKFEPANERAFYKIFATWRWEDRWRLSSGAYDVSELVREKHFFKWKQNSGSIYELPFDGEGCRLLWQSLKMESVIKQANEMECYVSIVKIKDLLNGLSEI